MSRSIADQTVEEVGGPSSVLVRQRDDHEELDRLLREMGSATGQVQEEVLRRVDRLVFSHAFAEEAVLWPLLRRMLPDGEALTLRVEEEHQEVNELVRELGTRPHDDPRRSERLSRLVQVLREDVREEEDVLFPRLQEELDPRDLRRLGRQWGFVRRIFPTRPHRRSHAVRRAMPCRLCRCRCSIAPAMSSTPRPAAHRALSRSRRGVSVEAWPG